MGQVGGGQETDEPLTKKKKREMRTMGLIENMQFAVESNGGRMTEEEYLKGF